MEKMSVALFGLGTMGHGMAANLLKEGFLLTVWNRTQSKAKPFSALGARVASTPAEAVKGARLVISILADDNASREAWLRERWGARCCQARCRSGGIQHRKPWLGG